VIFEIFSAIINLLAKMMFGVVQALVVIVLSLISQIIESKTLRSCIELSRPGNSIMAAVFTAIVILMAGTPDAALILTAASIVVASTAAGNAINDYYDRDIDAINKPNRPIPSKRIKSNLALGFAVLLFALSLIMSVFLISHSFFAFMIVVINIFLLVSYAVKLKKTGFIGNIVVSYLTGSTFLFAGAVVNTYESWLIGTVLAVCAFFITAGREISKNMEDVEGDRTLGAKTLPIVLGMNKSAKIAYGFIILVTILSPAPYLAGLFSWPYVPVIFLADILFLYSGYLLLKDPTAKTAARVQKLLKWGMFACLLAFVAGADKLYALANGWWL